MQICFGSFKLEEERIRTCFSVDTHLGTSSEVAALGFTPRMQDGREESHVTVSDHMAQVLLPRTGFGSHTSTGKSSVLHVAFIVKSTTSAGVCRDR